MKLIGWNPCFDRLLPIFEPLRPLAVAISKLNHWPTCEDLDNLKQQISSEVITYSGLPVRFISQEHAANNNFAQQYETRIYLTGTVITRSENWHDFFNALVWLTFPQAKATLNHIHYQALTHTSQHESSERGMLRDAATLFDYRCP